ncbi:hypothetical protein CAJAP_08823 [Camponotus japonicus]
MLTQELKDYAVMLLEDAETVRLKTKTMQGLSGILKDRITGLRGVIECLIEKLEDKGDTIYYKTKNSEFMSENRRLRKDAEKCEQERIMKDGEIESYRNMYEEADNRYVEAEKRIRRMDKRGNEMEEEKNRDNDEKQERMGEAHSRRGSLRFDEEKIDFVEETPQVRKNLDDQRWPAIRPPIQGKSRILTLPGKTKTPMRLARGQEEPNDETTPRSGNLVTRTAKRPLGTSVEPEKEKKTN